MLTGLHLIIYSKDPAADRKFFRDVLKFSNTDAGEGWLIFSSGPSETAFHPSESNNEHEAYLMCDDVYKQVEEIVSAGVTCDEIKEASWGLFSSITLPGGGKLGIYQPKHPTAINIS